MAIRPTLDLDLLRTFTLIAEERNFTRVSERIGRTQSAVSLQVQRLEAQLGQPLISRRRGGDVELTPAGRRLLEQARSLLALNDELLGSLVTGNAADTVRLGFPETFAQVFIPSILEQFSKSNPGVSIELTHAPSCQLVQMLKDDLLDLVVCVSGHEPPDMTGEELWRAPLRWVSSKDHDVHLEDPLPISIGPDNCPFRPAWLSECLWSGLAMDALKKSGRAFHAVSRVSSMEAQQLTVLAGTSVVVSVDLLVDSRLRTLGEPEGLPELPDTTLLLLRSSNSGNTNGEALAGVIGYVFREQASA